MYYNKRVKSFKMFVDNQVSIARIIKCLHWFQACFYLSSLLGIALSIYLIPSNWNWDLNLQTLLSWLVLNRLVYIQLNNKFHSYLRYNICSWWILGLKVFCIYCMMLGTVHGWFVSNNVLVALALCNVMVHCMYDIMQYSCWMCNHHLIDELIPVYRGNQRPIV